MDKLSDRYKPILYMLLQDFSQKEISQRLGFTQSWVSIVKKKIIVMLTDECCLYEDLKELIELKEKRDHENPKEKKKK